MVDQKKRNTIKKIGLAGAGLGLAGAGGAQLWNTVKASDDVFDPDTVVEDVEHDVHTLEADDDMTEIGTTVVDIDDVTVSYTHEGTTREGGDRYAYTLTAPLRDDLELTLCEHQGDRDGLLEFLYSDAIYLLEGFYDYAGGFNENKRAPHEDAIVSYTFRFEDDTGTATATLSADTMSGITRGDRYFWPDEYDQRADFRQELYRSIRVECEADG